MFHIFLRLSGECYEVLHRQSQTADTSFRLGNRNSFLASERQTVFILCIMYISKCAFYCLSSMYDFFFVFGIAICTRVVRTRFSAVCEKSVCQMTKKSVRRSAPDGPLQALFKQSFSLRLVCLISVHSKYSRMYRSPTTRKKQFSASLSLVCSLFRNNK